MQRCLGTGVIAVLVLAGCGASKQTGSHLHPQAHLGPGCDRAAKPSTLSLEVSDAGVGQTICLASGDYGTWPGTDKRVTVRAAPNSTPKMQVSFGPGASGFTLDGI